MTPDDLRAALNRLGISQAEAARLLGVDRASVTRWAKGQRPVPGPVARLLGAAEAVPVAFAYLRSIQAPYRPVSPP